MDECKNEKNDIISGKDNCVGGEKKIELSLINEQERLKGSQRKR